MIPSVHLKEISDRSEQGMTRPFICRGEDRRQYFVKGRYAGARSLCCEWIGHRLAKLMGLPVPEFFQAEVSAPLVEGSLRSDANDLGIGTVFASREVVDFQELNAARLKDVPGDLSATVLLFDLWTQNEDRSMGPDLQNPNLGWSADHGGLVVYDFNLAFDKAFDSKAFWTNHVFRDAAQQGWDLGYRGLILPKLDSALSSLDTIWQEIPALWMHPTGDPSDPPTLNRNEVEGILSRYRHVPDAFWKAPA